jgi:O-antigen/teichoic acid export membrane protein
MLLYGLPLIPTALSLWALALIDRVILGRLRNVADVGEYAIANRLASLLVIGMTAFLLALSPFLYSIYAEDPDKERAARGRTLTYLAFILCFAGLALTLFSREVIDVLAPKFHDAYKAVGPLALGTAVYGISAVLGQGISLARRTVHFATLTLIAAGVNIGLNFALIPPFGFVGAAIATAIGYGVLTVGYYIVAQRVYPTPYEPVKVIGMLGIASVLGAVGFYDYSNYAVALSAKVAALAAFVAVVWATGAMTRAEFIELRRFVSGMLALRPARADGA